MYSSGARMRASSTYKNPNTNDFARTSLANLPVDITDETKYKDVNVRSYPIAASNEVVFTGSVIAAGLTEDKFLALPRKMARL